MRGADRVRGLRQLVQPVVLGGAGHDQARAVREVDRDARAAARCLSWKRRVAPSDRLAITGLRPSPGSLSACHDDAVAAVAIEVQEHAVERLAGTGLGAPP